MYLNPLRTFCLSIALFTLTNISKAQEKAFEYDPGIPNQSFGIAKSYHTFNPADSSTAVFIIESNTVHGLFCDKNFSLRKKMVYEQKEKEYAALIGHSVEGRTVHLLFAGKKANELYAVSFDPEHDRMYGTWVPVIRPENEENEVFISAINHHNSLYILFIDKISSKLKLYHIASPAMVSSQTYDHSSPELYDQYFKNKHPLTNLSLEKALSKKLSPLATAIPDEVFNNLDITAAKNKVYSYSNHIVLTLDDDKTMTTLIEIDPENKTSATKHFSHLDGSAFAGTKTKSGSFYYRNNLLQLRGTEQQLVFTIRDVATDSLISLHEVSADSQEIPFVNMPFIEEVSKWAKKGKASPKKFLNKFENLDPALSAFQFGDTLEITIGGFSENKGNSGPMMMGSGGAMMGIGFSPPSETLLFTIGLFDPLTFSHLKGEVKPHIFIEMAKLNRLRHEVTSGEIKFQSGDAYYYGFYNSVKQKYFLFRYGE